LCPTDAHEHPLQDLDTELRREAVGEHRRLVEFPLHEAAAMEGDGDDGVKGRALKMRVEVCERQIEERAYDLQLAAIFEQMDGFP